MDSWGLPLARLGETSEGINKKSKSIQAAAAHQSQTLMCFSSFRETASRPAQMRLVALTTHRQHAKPPMPVGGYPAAQAGRAPRAATRAGAAARLQHNPVCLHRWLPLDLAELALGFHDVDVEGGSSRGKRDDDTRAHTRCARGEAKIGPDRKIGP